MARMAYVRHIRAHTPTRVTIIVSALAFHVDRSVEPALGVVVTAYRTTWPA
jgi:hypothetical protein